MTNKQLDKLNSRWMEVFGRTPDGRLRMKWFRTSQLHYYIEEGTSEPRLHRQGRLRRKGSLWLVETEYSRHSWAEVFGQGYIVGLWKPPVPHHDWLQRYGMSLPYPAGGEYEAIENTFLAVPEEPGEDLCRALVFAVQKQTDLKFQEIVDRINARDKAREKSQVDELEAEIGDAMTAFGNDPGKRSGSVSFGGI